MRGYLGPLGVHWRWQVDWETNHIGPQFRVPALPLDSLGKWSTSPGPDKGPYWGSHHFHWFPLGSDLPGQGQASDRDELCRLLYTFSTIFSVSLHICIYATSSYILTHKVKTCYMDCVLSRPIYTYPYTINLMYYDTMVLIMKNYFSHQTWKLGTSDSKCQDDLMQYCSLHLSCITFLLQQQNYKVTTTIKRFSYVLFNITHVDWYFCSCCTHSV